MFEKHLRARVFLLSDSVVLSLAPCGVVGTRQLGHPTAVCHIRHQVAAAASLSPAAARFFRPALSAACACTISTLAAVGRSSSGT